ncbi:MAG: radical SAM protein [Myxococcota bacterium]
MDRLAGDRGYCGLGAEGRVYKEYLHLGEERRLVPSHTVYLTGCSMRCAFCSDLGPVRRPEAHGVALSPRALAARIAKRRAQGARNVNFVGGVPDVNLLYALRTLAHCPPDTHVVWNTNLWTTEAVIRQLEGVVGTWLVDHKFGSDRCALELAGVRGYTDRLERLLPMAASTGRLVVRHLLMPGHLECCTRPVLEWLGRHLPDAGVNLMTGYQPFHLAGRAGPLGGPVSGEERAEAVSLLGHVGLRDPMLDGVEYPASS